MELPNWHGSLPDPGPKPLSVVSGRRVLKVQQAVRLEEVMNASDHEVKMSEFAARAVRVFSESALEVEWHTLNFHVERVGMGESFTWRWTVWAI